MNVFNRSANSVCHSSDSVLTKDAHKTDGRGPVVEWWWVENLLHRFLEDVPHPPPTYTHTRAVTLRKVV